MTEIVFMAQLCIPWVFVPVIAFLVSKQEVSSAEPEVSSAEPEVSSAEPEVSSAEPEVA